jgi:hypothetical protein
MGLKRKGGEGYGRGVESDHHRFLEQIFGESHRILTQSTGDDHHPRRRVFHRLDLQKAPFSFPEGNSVRQGEQTMGFG